MPEQDSLIPENLRISGWQKGPRHRGITMKRTSILVSTLTILSSIFAALPVSAYAYESQVHVKTVVTYAIPPTDDSMTNPHYQLLSFHWYATINYWINPSNKYKLSTTAVVDTIVTSANTWDKETAGAVFAYQSTTTRTAGKRDFYNVISWGNTQRGIIAVTSIWYVGDQIIETDCKMNTYYKWSLTGEAGKMDVQNIMTHELGHFASLADLYSDADYWLTMYGYADYGETYKRTLGLGDINGLEAVYGP